MGTKRVDHPLTHECNPGVVQAFQGGYPPPYARHQVDQNAQRQHRVNHKHGCCRHPNSHEGIKVAASVRVPHSLQSETVPMLEHARCRTSQLPRTRLRGYERALTFMRCTTRSRRSSFSSSNACVPCRFPPWAARRAICPMTGNVAIKSTQNVPFLI